MNAVNWFEVPVTDISRAKKFYGSVLNIEFQDVDMFGTKMAMFPWEQGVDGSSGALVQGEDYEPSTKGSIVYFSCDGVTAGLGRVKNAGGNPITEAINIGDHGFIAMFIDSEGNKVALHSTNE